MLTAHDPVKPLNTVDIFLIYEFGCLWADSNTSVSLLFVVYNAFGKNSAKTLESFSSKNGGGNDRCESEHHSVKVIPHFVFLKSFFSLYWFRTI